MTLEEAIKHCEEVAEQFERKKELTAVTLEMYKSAKEHSRLAEWLKLLKRILESGDCNECVIQKVCNVRPKWGEQVRYNCPLFVREESE